MIFKTPQGFQNSEKVTQSLIKLKMEFVFENDEEQDEDIPFYFQNSEISLLVQVYCYKNESTDDNIKQ